MFRQDVGETCSEVNSKPTQQKYSTMSLNLPIPSPIPSTTLSKMRPYMEVAKKGVMKVDNDHIKTARVKMFFPPYFLAALPPMT